MLNAWNSWLRRNQLQALIKRKPESRQRALRKKTIKPLDVEALEMRQLLSAVNPSMDGSGNNEANPEWGAANTPLLRLTTAEYGDGASTLAGQDRPSAREVSNNLVAQAESVTNDRNLSDFVWQWGQFLDHDIDLTGAADPAEAANIDVPRGDASFDPNSDGDKVIPLSRSVYDTNTGDSAANPRQQLNGITSFIDGSSVYGSDEQRAAELRTFSRGKLKDSPGDLLPFNTNGMDNASTPQLDPSQFYLAGDVRANEQIGLTTMHMLFVREHNRVASEVAAADPWLTDEEIYQTARAKVTAQLQAISYNEFLPALLGQGALDAYAGYDATVNPSIANVFSTAAYRFGHSMVSDTLLQLDADGNEIASGHVPLKDSFFNPAYIQEVGLEPTLRGLVAQKAQELDTQVVDGLRNFLFGAPGSGGFDLASLNIQRGRDHGLPDYNQTRVDFGLDPVAHFGEITSDPALQQALEDTYGDVDSIDLWIGGLAEDHVAGGSMGETFRTIVTDQFERLRDGDRFWYQNLYFGSELNEIESTTLADIIIRNTTITEAEIPDNVFFVGGMPVDPGDGSGGGDGGLGGGNGGGPSNGLPGNSPATAGLIQPGTSIDAAIDHHGEFDYYKFNAIAGGEFAIETDLGTLQDSFLYLYGTDGTTVIQTNDDAGGPHSRIEFVAPETGTYFFAVAAYNDYLTGTYEVSLTKTDDHGDSPVSATPATIGRTIDGNIEKQDDDDWFAFVAEAGQTYTFQTSLVTLPDTTLWLFAPDGVSELDGNDDYGGSSASRLVWTAPATGTYFLQVGPYGNAYTGEYTLGLFEGEVDFDPDGTGGGSDNGGGDTGGGSGGDTGGGGSGGTVVVPDSTTLLTLGTPEEGSIDDNADVDWYSVELTQGAEYTFATTLDTLADSALHLFHTDRATQLASNDDHEGPASRIQFIPQTSGRYYLAVTGFYGAFGTYSLEAIQSDDYGDDPSAAFPADINTSYNAVINDTEDTDWFAFQAAEGTTYEIETTLYGLTDSVLVLYGEDGYTPLAANDDAGGPQSRIEWTAPDDGTYFVQVAPYGGAFAGNYSLWIGDGNVQNDGGNGSGSGTGSGGDSGGGDPGNGDGSGGDTGGGDHGNPSLPTPPDNADRLSLDTVTPGNIEDAGEFDWYAIDVQQGAEYSVATSIGTLVDTEMYLYASDRATLLDYNDDEHGAAAALSFTAAETGSYYIGVTGYGHLAGTYNVLATQTDDFGDTPATASLVTVNQRYDGEITEHDVDVFAFAAEAGTDYTLQLRSGSLRDAVITLHNLDGSVITHSESTSTGQRLDWTATRTDTFYASVVPYHGTFTGTYQFMIGRLNAGPPAKAQFTHQIGTTGDPTPTFTWTAVDRAVRYDLWVNNVTTGESQVIREATLTTTEFTPTTPLPEGTYRAFVKAFDADRDNSGWSDPMEFTVEVGAPVSPDLDGPSGETPDSTPTFTWSAIDNAETYELLIENLDDGGTATINETGLTATTYTVADDAALTEARYQAWVRGVNALGEPGPWSRVLTFEVSVPRPGTSGITGPEAITTNGRPTITWTEVANVSSYELRIDNVTTGENDIYTPAGITSTSWTFPDNLTDNTYRVQVRAINTLNEAGPWSDAYEFRVDVPLPARAVLLGPAGTTDSTPVFEWQELTNAARYEIWVDNETTGERAVIRETELTGTSWEATTPLPSGTYKVYSRAYNSSGERGPWSTPIEFTVESTRPAKPVLDGDTDTPTPSLRWDAVEHAVRYDLWIDNIETGQRQVVRDTDLTTTTWTGSLPAGNYRAFLRAFNVDQENGNWSSRFEFTVTANSGSDTGSGDSGSDSGIGDSNTGTTGDITTRTVILTGNTHVPNGLPSLSWNHIPEATRYDLWINNQTTGERQVVREATLTDETWTATEQLPEGTYRAFVKAFDADRNMTDWSQPVEFTVGQTSGDDSTDTDTGSDSGNNTYDITQETVVLTGDTVVHGGRPTLNWNEVQGAIRYDLWINNQTTGERQVVRVATLTDTTWTATSSLDDGVYRAYVKAFDQYRNMTEWSAPLEFTVVSGRPNKPEGLTSSNESTGHPILSWNQDLNSTGYDLWIDNISTGEAQVYRQRELTSNTHEVLTLLPSGTYRYWVRGISATGEYGDWSTRHDFTV